MTTKTRLKGIEQARKAQSNNGMKRIFVYYEGKDTGRLDGVQLSRAEWDKIKTDNDTEIVVQYVDACDVQKDFTAKDKTQ